MAKYINIYVENQLKIMYLFKKIYNLFNKIDVITGYVEMSRIC